MASVDVNGGVSGRVLVGSRAGGETHDDDDDDRHDGERRCGGQPVALTTCVSEHQLLKHYYICERVTIESVSSNVAQLGH